MSSPKLGPCPKCPKGSADTRLYGTGVCGYHLAHPEDDHSKERAVKEAKKYIVGEQELRRWYEEQFNSRPELCENCKNVRLIDPKELWRQKAMVCHILPKKLFPSVATHPLNRWFGDHQCHHDFDSSWAHAQTMPIWPTVVERFTQFMHSITTGEHRHLPAPLREILDKSFT